MSEPKRLHQLCLVLLSIIWGTSFILIKKGLVAYSPLQLAALRMGIASLSLFIPAIFFFTKERPKEPWYKYLFVSLVGSAIPIFLYAIAQTQVSSSTTGILNSLTPIFTLLFGILVFSAPTKKLQIVGILIGFIGSILLIASMGSSVRPSSPLFASLVIIGSACYGFGSNYIKFNFSNESSLRITAFSFALLLIPSAIYIGLSDIPQIMQTKAGLLAFGYILLLTLVSTVLAVVIYFWLIQKTNPVFASSIAYLIPIVSVIWGYVDNEYLGLTHIVSLLIIISGLYLIQRS